jgi:hypothetical protein
MSPASRAQTSADVDSVVRSRSHSVETEIDFKLSFWGAPLSCPIDPPYKLSDAGIDFRERCSIY